MACLGSSKEHDTVVSAESLHPGCCDTRIFPHFVSSYPKMQLSCPAVEHGVTTGKAVPFETGGELPHVIGIHPRRVFPVSYQENTLLFVGGVDGQDAHHHKICWERLRTSRR